MPHHNAATRCTAWISLREKLRQAGIGMGIRLTAPTAYAVFKGAVSGSKTTDFGKKPLPRRGPEGPLPLRDALTPAEPGFWAAPAAR